MNLLCSSSRIVFKIKGQALGMRFPGVPWLGPGLGLVSPCGCGAAGARALRACDIWRRLAFQVFVLKQRKNFCGGPRFWEAHDGVRQVGLQRGLRHGSMGSGQLVLGRYVLTVVLKYYSINRAFSLNFGMHREPQIWDATLRLGSALGLGSEQSVPRAQNSRVCRASQNGRNRSPNLRIPFKFGRV